MERISLDKKQGLAKAQKYCSYQERCHEEVRARLKLWGLSSNDMEDIMADLISENFLNEERFALQYALGKFRIKKWGRIRIENELQQKRVSAYSIRKALKAIDMDDYRKTLHKELQDKWDSVAESNLHIKKYKVSKFLIGRGFEPELVWGILKEED